MLHINIAYKRLQKEGALSRRYFLRILFLFLFYLHIYIYICVCLYIYIRIYINIYIRIQYNYLYIYLYIYLFLFDLFFHFSWNDFYLSLNYAFSVKDYAPQDLRCSSQLLIPLSIAVPRSLYVFFVYSFSFFLFALFIKYRPSPTIFFSLFLTLSLSSLPCGILYFHFVFFLRLSLSCFLTFYASFVSFIHPPPHPLFFSFIKVYLFARLSFIVKDIFSFFFFIFFISLKTFTISFTFIFTFLFNFYF